VIDNGSFQLGEKFAALALVEQRSAPIRNRKVQQILHSTFGYVQDDEHCRPALISVQAELFATFREQT
jgi:hypothetical protein